MDFLKIRRKAKEKAAARSAPGAVAEPVPPPPAASDTAVAPPAVDPAAADADALEGELAARLHGVAVPGDARFTTWRPGSAIPDEAATEPAGSGGAAAAHPPEAAGAARERRPEPLEEFFYREDEEAPEVPAVGAPEEPVAEEDPEAVAREEYLTFALGSEEYAVAIERVREVMRCPPITEVPRAPRHVLGVVTVRGEVVTVFDPRRRLGLPGAAPGPDAGRIVIVDAGEGPCGLLVDAVSSVVRLRPGSIEARPQGIGGASAECLAGIGRQGGRLFTVLDLGAFLRRPAAGRGADEGDRHAAP